MWHAGVTRKSKPFDQMTLVNYHRTADARINISQSFESAKGNNLIVDQDPVVQRADNSIQWINRYPADKMYPNQYILSVWIATYPLVKVIRSLTNWGQMDSKCYFRLLRSSCAPLGEEERCCVTGPNNYSTCTAKEPSVSMVTFVCEGETFPTQPSPDHRL